MAEEIAGLYVNIGADLSELLSGLEQTQILLTELGTNTGIFSNLTQGIPTQFQQMLVGIQTALVPLPTLLANNLQRPLDTVLAAVKARLDQQIEDLINSLYAMAARVHRVAGQLGVPSPINAEELQGRASGGSVVAGQAYLVGEAGPEIFLPGTSGSIIPNHALGGGGQGLSIQGGTFHIYGVQDAESLYDQLQQVARSRG